MSQDDAESKQMLSQALGAADDWLRKQGVLTDFSFNTILTWLYVNFEKVQNVELDVDRPQQRLYVRVYLTFWTLFWMTLFRKKDTFLDLIFNWLSEYLPTYQVSVELVRYRGQGRALAIDPGPTPESEKPEISGNIAAALQEKKQRLSQKEAKSEIPPKRDNPAQA